MKWCLAVVAALAVAMTVHSGGELSLAQQDDKKSEPSKLEWKDFTSKECGFTAQFPSTPKEASKKDSMGNLTRTFSADLDQGTVNFTIMCSQFSQDFGATDPMMILDAIANSFGKSVKKKEIKLGDHPGLEFMAEIDQKDVKMNMTSRIYLVKGRLYQLMATSIRGKQNADEIKKFLESFKLNEKEKQQE
jgi:hypothetical protein